MHIYSDGCIDNGVEFEVAVYRGRTVEFDPHDGAIFILKRDEEPRSMTYKQFDDLFYIVNETSDAALKEDCIFYRVVNDGVVLKNHEGSERFISMDTFLSMYTI